MAGVRSFRSVFFHICSRVLLIVLLSSSTLFGNAFTSTPFGMIRPTNIHTSTKPPPLTMTGAGDEVNPSTFREAEVLGLKLMQEQKYKEALQGKRGCVCVYHVLFYCFVDI
jgi:hypothetical protein